MSCFPAYPCCLPVDPCPAPLPQGPPLSYTAQELDALPQCERQNKTYPTRSILVQQPPQILTKKRQIVVEKIVNIPNVCNRSQSYMYPKITQCPKVVKIPVIRYFTEIVREPKISWFQSYKADPYIIAVPRTVIQPKEICQTLLCQPKPQVVDVPTPRDYCVYPAGPEKMRCAFSCPPYPCPPTSGFRPCVPYGLCGSNDIRCYPYKPVGPPDNTPSPQCCVPCTPCPPCSNYPQYINPCPPVCSPC